MIRVEFVSEVTSDRCTGREISFHRIGSKIGMQDRNHFTIFPSVSVFQNYIILLFKKYTFLGIFHRPSIRKRTRVFQVVKLASRKIINDRTSKREGDSLSSSPGWLDLDRSIRRTGIARNIFTRLLQLSSQEEESPSVVGYLFSKQNSAGRGGVARS